MYALFSRYYDGIERETFDSDLAQKQYVIRMFSHAELVGFSTIQLLHTDFQGRPVTTLFSGDTVVDHRCWGQKALQRGFVSFVTKLKLGHPRHRVFWFLISKGYKTYLLIRHNFLAFPARDRDTPGEVKVLLDQVAKLKYADSYDPSRGVISFSQSQGQVKDEFEDLGPEDLKNPDIAFFVEQNPGFREGDELCCLAEIRLRDLAYIGLKYFVFKPLLSIFRRR